MKSVDLQSIYKSERPEESIATESKECYYANGYIIDKGVYLDIMGMEYPSRSVAPLNNLWAMNIAKRMFVNSLKAFILLPKLLIRPIKTLDQLICLYNDTALKATKPHLWRDELLSPIAQELKSFIALFLLELGISLKTSLDFAEIMANMINIDDAYRFRLLDILNESSAEQLQQPRKELKRLTNIFIEREGDKTVANKVKPMFRLITIVILIPRVRRAFVKAINMVEYNKLKPDKIDWFWICLKKGNQYSYQYFGKSEEERLKMVSHLNVIKPSKL